MRRLLIFGLIALAGCATRPSSSSIEWSIVKAHPSGTPEPTVQNGQLVLSGRAARSSKTYAAPATIECELQPQQASTNSTFYIDLVPEGQSLDVLPVDYLGIKLVHDQQLYVWLSQGSQPTQLIKPVSVHADSEGGYKLSVELRPDGLGIRVNNETFKIDKVMPFDKFRIELRTFPPANSWQIRNLSVY